MDFRTSLEDEVRSNPQSRHGQTAALLQERGWLSPELADSVYADSPDEPSPPCFGVEAEFFGIPIDEALGCLERVGLDADCDGYHHEVRSFWRVTTDSSVTSWNCQTEAEGGLELVTPVLKHQGQFSGDMLSLGRALRSLHKTGAEVDKSCGLHVHHSTKGMTPEAIGQVVAFYTVFQPVIHTMLPKSRWGDGRFNDPLEGDPQRFVDWASKYQHRNQMARDACDWDRQASVNLEALEIHGTLEFRQHNGTLNPKKASNWIRFTKLFMDLPLKGLRYQDLKKEFGSLDAIQKHFDNIPVMMAFIGADKPMMYFYVDRSQKLAKIEGTGVDAVKDDKKKADAEDFAVMSLKGEVYDDDEEDVIS